MFVRYVYVAIEKYHELVGLNRAQTKRTVLLSF